MTAEKLANAILNKCDIYYDRCLISKEAIIERYLSYFSDFLVSDKKTVNFALHTGSVCFDVISVIAVALGCLSYNMSTNDDIISSLQIDDMIMFRSQRYRWKGTTVKYDKLCMALEQDGTGKNGKTTSYLPLEKNKHLVKPYYGDSLVTDGRGIKKSKNNREDFLSYVFDVELSEVPAQIDVSIVIVTDRMALDEILRKVNITYDNGKNITLLDIVPAAYYTSTLEEHQFGSNPTKAEPVLKATAKISTARELVLDKTGNKVVGLLVADSRAVTENSPELADLLRRQTLRFVLFTSVIRLGFAERILDMYEDASVFACTKEFFAQKTKWVSSKNTYTTELQRQISNIIDNKVTPINVAGGWSWEAYKKIQNDLYIIKQSNWQDSSKEDFVMTASGLIKLFNTSVFKLCVLEHAVSDGVIHSGVISPSQRLSELINLSESAGSLQTLCLNLTEILNQMYDHLLTVSEKETALFEYIGNHRGQKIAIVVPKAYYTDILHRYYPELFEMCDLICTTPNRFDTREEYNAVLTVGELNNKKFDPLQCAGIRNVDVLLYACEQKTFSFRQRKNKGVERRLNAKIGAIDATAEIETEDISDENEVSEEISRFGSIDEYIENLNLSGIRALAVGNGVSGNGIMTAEVKFVGAFSTGEKIFFSKYYSAVTFDAETESVVEKTPEQLQSGDVLVFVKKNDYTRNIVDYIYEGLLKDGRLKSGAVEAFEKSQYWKEVLREYKKSHDLTYRGVAKQLSAVGNDVQEVTLRQWMIEDSHIVGPKKEETIEQIARMTKDPFLLNDSHSYFEACREVRHDRREILTLIAKAINDKLRGNLPTPGSVMEIVYTNVESLSETLELEQISELDEIVNINSNLVNRPLTEAEV